MVSRLRRGEPGAEPPRRQRHVVHAGVDLQDGDLHRRDAGGRGRVVHPGRRRGRRVAVLGADPRVPQPEDHGAPVADAHLVDPRPVAGLGRPVLRGRFTDRTRRVPGGLPGARRRGLPRGQLLRVRAGEGLSLLERGRVVGGLSGGGGERHRVRRVVQRSDLRAAGDDPSGMASGGRASQRGGHAVSLVARSGQRTSRTASTATPTTPTAPCAPRPVSCATTWAW